jgi:Cu-Zn family superoxide dismutase
MRKHTLLGAMAVLGLALALGGCEMDHHVDTWKGVTKAVAVLKPTSAGNGVAGTIVFEQMGDHVHITGTVTGLAPNSTHGFHIHEYGDASSADGSSAGAHFNPEKHDHGALNAADSHAGDMGNITADANGTAHVDIMAHGVTIAGMHDPIIGRGVVVHANADDLKTVTSAGARIAVGAIGIAKP